MIKADKAGGTPPTHQGAETLINDASAAELRERKPIETIEQLGKAFIAWLKRNPLPAAAHEKARIGLNDEDWRDQPITLWNSWHRDPATRWNFNVFEGRLVEVASDAAMAGTVGQRKKPAA